ncbi:uncharacterized protein LOC143197036 [Rhynchophorus ferrugineus]|uniref:uncharacterized protein LOC143197036 n=1 Tax=Rhynchophorus ferrugineus TaxID=354439 RepID=UPI003FCD4657
MYSKFCEDYARTGIRREQPIQRNGCPTQLANHFQLVSFAYNENGSDKVRVSSVNNHPLQSYSTGPNVLRQEHYNLNGSGQIHQKKNVQTQGQFNKEVPVPLMQLPKPRSISIRNNQTISSASNIASKESNLSLRKFGESETERTFIFTGTAERIIKWGKIFQNHFCYFEVIAGVISLAEGRFQFETTMLLRDKKGPILQVTYFSTATHIDIEDFHIGQMLRIVGRMTGTNTMTAHTIRAATGDEVEALPRMCHICDQAITSFCGDALSR